MNYGMVRVGAAVPKCKVADVKYNVTEIIDIMKRADQQKTKILVFPELSICGYTCGDLFHNDSLEMSISEGISEILQAAEKLDILIAIGLPLRIREKYFNVALLIHKEKIIAAIPKTFIPVNGEYYEERWFSPAFELEDSEIVICGQIVPIGVDILVKSHSEPDICIGVELCEDLWSPLPPSTILAHKGATIILNLSASNENVGKSRIREKMIESQSLRCRTAYVYSGAGTGESSTDHVYSGYSVIYENGIKQIEGELFKDNSLIITDIDTQLLRKERSKVVGFLKKNPNLAPMEFRILNVEFDEFSEEICRNVEQMPFMRNLNISEISNDVLNLQREALIKKLTYEKKDTVIIGISGGLDSTLALISCMQAYRKMGKSCKKIVAVTMPGPGTTERTLGNAMKLMQLFGVTSLNIDIQEVIEKHLERIGQPQGLHDITYEQAQSRERTQILMDLSNKENGIVIGTGDLSELALGWMSYCGDQMSMYAINSGLPKSMLRSVIQYYAEECDEELKTVLFDIMDTPISPELLPVNEAGMQMQKTEELVGPYIVHDFFLYYVIWYGFSILKILILAEIAFDGIYSRNQLIAWMKIFIHRFFSRQFKRTCFPDGLQLWNVSLSPRGYWRMPSDVEIATWSNELDQLS